MMWRERKEFLWRDLKSYRGKKRHYNVLMCFILSIVLFVQVIIVVNVSESVSTGLVVHPALETRYISRQQKIKI